MSLEMLISPIVTRAISTSIGVSAQTLSFSSIGVRFPMGPLIIGTLRFYDLCPDQLPPNFYQVVSCVSRLNQIFGLQLNHYDINFMYSLCGNIRSDYYLKTGICGYD